MALEFKCFAPINPQPWRRARTHGKRHFTDDKTRAYKDAIALFVKAQMRGADLTTQAVRLDLVFCFPIPESWPKHKKLRPPKHIIRPDKDNLEKGVMDALNGIVWKDDAQVYAGETKKMYSGSPGILISISAEAET